MQFAFGEFVLDSDVREVRRGTERVHLSPKAFQLLETLVESRPRALSKSELHRRLWPDTFVVETNLANLVGEVRAALGDDARRPRFIRTVQRYGYSFEDASPAADQRAAASVPAPLYRLVWKGGRAMLAEGEHVLGRDPDLELCFESPSVSRRHARVRVGASEAVLEDLGSKNGTWVNERRARGPVLLADRDQIRLGNSIRLTFRKLSPAVSTETSGSRDD